MDALRSVSGTRCINVMESDSEISPKFRELSFFLSEWLEQNSEVINRQFCYAASEAAKNSSDKNEIARLFVSEIITQGLAYVADAEHETAVRRQAEGIKAAKERGVRFGRQKMEIPKKFYPLCIRYKNGELSVRKCAEKLNVSHSTFLKWVKEVE